MAYAAGTLVPGMALLVACHLESCADCRDRLAQAEAVGGALLEELPPVALDSDNALASVLGLLDSEPPAAAAPAPLSGARAGGPAMPKVLAQHLDGRDFDALEWRSLAPGVKQIDLHPGGAGATRLLRFAPGVSVPHHSHRGNELTLVLRGSYNDEVGRFCAGDVADLDDQVAHQPLNDANEDCICLIATDAPLRFSGLMGRLVQPFIGM
ncbi:anti-sigma-E factor ChrR [Marinobacterium nitratireducens]|uniref:Anti-sigma-E factor ChrR n=2 Tax=Marinobacterium nitratireducens TaxID=518897 RepID=A0A918DR67_9GAMM|nr:anti-sigma-E factor ChrR [Marinobacterium nitratireducens]